MKILIVSAHPLFDNRIEKHIRTCLRYGMKVEYCNASDTSEQLFSFDQEDGVLLRHICEAPEKNNRKGIIKIIWFMYRILKSSDAELVHIHDPFLLFLSKPAVKRGKKVFFDRHEGYETVDCLNARVGLWMERHYRQYIAKTICVNDSLAEYVNRLRGDEAVIIPNYQPAESYLIKHTPKHADGYVRSTFVARDLSDLSAYDGELLFRVVERVLALCPNFIFTIGGDSVYYTDRKARLKNKYPDRFFDIGLVLYHEVVEQNLVSDIGFMFLKKEYSQKKSSPNKLSEYLLSGQAIFAIGNFQDETILKESGAAVLFDFGTDADTIADQVTELVRDVDRLEEVQRNAVSAGSPLTWEHYAVRYIELYRQYAKKK